MRRHWQCILVAALILASLFLPSCSCPPEPSDTAPPERQTPAFDLQAAWEALEKLKGYYGEFHVRWEGARDGAPAAGRFDMELLQSRDPAAQDVFVSLYPDGAATRDVVAWVQIGDQGWFYRQSRADTWRETSARTLQEHVGPTLIMPEELFDDFTLYIEALTPEPERVNGVLAYVYHFDDQDFSAKTMGFSDAYGSVSVSVEGGYLVSFSLIADVTGREGDGVLDAGTLQVRFNVSRADPSFTVAPPRTMRTDFPLPPDVRLPDPTPVPLSQREDWTPPSGQEIVYQTEMSVADVAELYRTAMPEHGWEAFTYDLPLGAGTGPGIARLNDVKGDESATLTVEDKEGMTTVRIRLGDAEELRRAPCVTPSHCSVLVLTDFPAPPDAHVGVFMSGGGLDGRLDYETTCSPDVVAQFYDKALPAQGWRAADVVDLTPEPGTRMLDYVKEGETLGISITQGRDATVVQVEAGPAALAIWGDLGLEDVDIARAFPRVPDATVNRLLPGQLRYLTRYGVDEVVQFYEATLPEDSWQVKGGAARDAETTLLRYVKGAVMATLMVEPGTEGSVVRVTLYRDKHDK